MGSHLMKLISTLPSIIFTMSKMVTGQASAST
jgi:hypothetical protein